MRRKRGKRGTAVITKIMERKNRKKVGERERENTLNHKFTRLLNFYRTVKRNSKVNEIVQVKRFPASAFTTEVFQKQLLPNQW